mmetsp:Transcript_22822/g.48253  ORF Transcript_22822/g.48253 Transcript_22822/m.48253 type:complete len:416 (-) Transcript_22822:44-1291(-)
MTTSFGILVLSSKLPSSSSRYHQNILLLLLLLLVHLRESGKQVRELGGVEVRVDRVLLAEQGLLPRDAAEDEHGLQPPVLAELDVGVQPVPHHANLALVDLELLRDVVQHEGGGLSHGRGLPGRAPRDGPHHGPVPGPLLGVRQVRHGVPVGGDELARLVLPDAEGRVLDLVVVDLAVEPHDHGRHVRVVLHLHALAQGDLLPLVLGAAKVRDARQRELLHDPHLPDDVHLLRPVRREVLALQVGRRGIAAAVDLLRGDVQPERQELLQVALARLGRVVRDEDELLARLAQRLDGLRDPLDELVAAPDDAVAVEDEGLGPVQEALGAVLVELLRRRRRRLHAHARRHAHVAVDGAAAAVPGEGGRRGGAGEARGGRRTYRRCGRNPGRRRPLCACRRGQTPLLARRRFHRVSRWC